MSGLLPRIRRRRSSPPSTSQQLSATPPPPNPPADSVAAPTAPAQQPFDLPGFRARGQLRRRLRYLRRTRELALRDIGGLVADLDRFGRSRDELVRRKLDALAALDAELSAVDAALGNDASFDELREIGVLPCPSCGALLASEARFCSACGKRVDLGEAPVETAFASSTGTDAA